MYNVICRPMLPRITNLVAFSDYLQDFSNLKKAFPRLAVGFSPEEQRIMDFVDKIPKWKFRIPRSRQLTAKEAKDQENLKLRFKQLLAQVDPSFHRNYLLRLTAAKGFTDFISIAI